MYLIDPDVLDGLPPQDRFKYRYAVIEDGEVRVEEGNLSSSGWEARVTGGRVRPPG